jgi:threonylcarbamoyladenosine tRNA methylthiotransferase MtaB
MVVTLGCRLNMAESDAMRTWAQEQNLKNAIIINTCAVTQEAERQARQTIRKLKRDNPDAYIIATGCAVQLRPQQFERMPEIDRLVGNNDKDNPQAFAPNHTPKQVGPMTQTSVDQAPLITPAVGQVKAFVQVQNGCNHFCTFCTIAIARGRSRSVSVPKVINQISHYVDHGIEEIILTGVDLTSYHDDAYPGGLGRLIEEVLGAVPSLQRLRISSIDSMEVDDLLLNLITTEKRIMPHVHLSLQAGSNAILSAMKRRHQREHAIDLCQSLKSKRPAIAIGADFIVGFPGETEAMFEQTMDLVDACGLTHLHVFPFSKRPGTPAARMPDQIDGSVIKQRAAMLRTRGQQALHHHMSSYKGQTVTVLMENHNRGHTDDFLPVTVLHSDNTPPAPLRIVSVLVQDISNNSLVGVIPNPPA